MKRESLELNLRRQALGWMTAGIALTLALSGSLSVILTFKDTERQIETFATSALASERTEILSGDIRSTELRLKKDFDIRGGEKVLFLDADKKPWLRDFDSASLEACADGVLCRSWLSQKIILERPIFFDDEGKHLWGYIHIEKRPNPNWTLVFSVALAVISGMLFQGLGTYYKMSKSVRSVSQVLLSWAERLSSSPKDQSSYQSIPFTELEPIGKALVGLKEEIDTLEAAAREQGALVTLRGIGHDILNPVARMKRLIGLMEIQGTVDAELVATFSSNLKRLSGYAEQLKLIYKYKNGEAQSLASITNVSKEIQSLLKDLNCDSDVTGKRLNISSEITSDCYVRIPAPAFGRVIENIVSNGIHASKDGGSISVRVDSDAHVTRVQVQDDGIGIPFEYQEKVFDPDFTTKGNKGTGLGLFVVKQVCEQYGGRVSFHSEPGQTVFTLEFSNSEGSHGLQTVIG